MFKLCLIQFCRIEGNEQHWFRPNVNGFKMKGNLLKSYTHYRDKTQLLEANGFYFTMNFKQKDKDRSMLARWYAYQRYRI